jgi:hypothetical protein
VLRRTAGWLLLALAALILFDASVHTNSPVRLDCGASPAQLMFATASGSLTRQCVGAARQDATGAAFLAFLGLALLLPRRRRAGVAPPALPAIPPAPGTLAEPGPAWVGDPPAPFEARVEYRVGDYSPAVRRALVVRQRNTTLCMVVGAAALGFVNSWWPGALAFSGLLAAGWVTVLPVLTAAGTVRRTQSGPGSRPIRLRIDRDGVTVENTNTASQTRWGWSALGRTVETERAVLIEVGRGYLILPKHALSPDELASATRWLERRTTPPDRLPVG